MTAAVCFIAAFSSNCPRGAFCSTNAAREAQFFPVQVQEARYQFSGYIKIGKALTFGTAESTSRIGKSTPETGPILCA
jgi:hypothetical protein